MTHRYAVKVAYNGRPFHGFVRQPTVSTVEGTILGLLQEKKIIADPSSFRYASRTDKGVSSLGNVIAFSTPLRIDKVQQLLLSRHDDLLFYAILQVDDTFFPRYARLRQYRYYLPITTLQIDDLITILSLFTGEHDFSNFARIEPGKNPVRSIDSIVVSEIRSFFIIDFYAQTFLWHQLRRILGAIVTFSLGKISCEDIKQAISNPKHIVDFGMAPGENLVLYDVLYGFNFEILPEMKQHLHRFEQELFEQVLNSEQN